MKMHHYYRPRCGSVRGIALLGLVAMCVAISATAVASPSAPVRPSRASRLLDVEPRTQFPSSSKNKRHGRDKDTTPTTTTPPTSTTSATELPTTKKKFADLATDLDYFPDDTDSQETAENSGNKKGIDIAVVQGQLDECNANLETAEERRQDDVNAINLKVAIQEMCSTMAERRYVNEKVWKVCNISGIRIAREEFGLGEIRTPDPSSKVLAGAVATGPTTIPVADIHHPASFEAQAPTGGQSRVHPQLPFSSTEPAVSNSASVGTTGRHSARK